MYIGYDQVPVTTNVLTSSSLNATMLARATHAEIMCGAQGVGSNVAISYTMDGATAPGDERGMVFRLTDPPKLFLIEDVKNIKFCAVEGGAGHLHVHYIASH